MSRIDKCWMAAGVLVTITLLALLVVALFGR